MLRTKLSLSRFLSRSVAACCTLAVAGPALAAPPQVPGAMEPDYAASGFVVPAGYAELPSPGTGQVVQANAPYGPAPQQAVSQVGLFSPAHHGAVCDAGCGTMGCDGGCSSGGLLGGCFSGAGCECSSCSGLSDWRHACLFCGGDGCGVCQSIGRGYLAGMLAGLAPYTEAGLGAQRWYDFSAEALFLSLDNDITSFDVTSLGAGVPPNVVLRTIDAYNDDLEAGVRLSGSMIFGAGGNLEVTYMGVNNLGGSGSVSSLTPDYFSFISDFGTNPPGGFDDTDNSLFQGVRSDTRFHTGEFNYRRRWVGPYSRFQGSWLAGIRIVDLDDQFAYRTVGLNNDTVAADDLRFFESRFKASNSMTGFQLGGDLWWHLYPGISLGAELKGAVLGNTARLDALVESNSIGPAGVNFPLGLNGAVKDSETSFMTELSLTALYRFSYSWSFRSSYYLIDLTDVALGAPALSSSQLSGIGTGGPTIDLQPLSARNDVQLTGMSFGLEYTW